MYSQGGLAHVKVERWLPAPVGARNGVVNGGRPGPRDRVPEVARQVLHREGRQRALYGHGKLRGREAHGCHVVGALHAGSDMCTISDQCTNER